MQTNPSDEVEADQTPETLPRDGERFLPDMRGRIAAEHLLRYHWAAAFVDDRDVLDLACGEGYGSYLLAAQAKSVVGCDIAETVVDHARLKYHRDNLTFDIADITALPYADNSFDVITCFETIEHVDFVQAAVAELRRILRSDGVLLISTPNISIYTVKYHHFNPFHKNEMELQEFSDLLSNHFLSVKMAGQVSSFSSSIKCLPGPDLHPHDGSAITVFPDQSDQLVPEAVIQYFVAICSSGEDGRTVHSAIYCDASDDSDITAEMAAVRVATEIQQGLPSEGSFLEPATPSHALVSLDHGNEVRALEVKYNEFLVLNQDLQRKHDLLRAGRKVEKIQRDAEISALRAELGRYIESTTFQFKQLQAQHRDLWKLNDGLRQAKVAAESGRKDIEALRCKDLDIMRSQAHALRNRLLHLQSYASALADQSRTASMLESSEPAEEVDALPPSQHLELPHSPARLVAAMLRIRPMLAALIDRTRLRARLPR